jgi:hypothetical protein
MLNTRFIEMRMFKEVPGGFIFQLPPPTIFTATEAVLVTASQREEILAITRKGSQIARRAARTVAAIGRVPVPGRAEAQLDGLPLGSAVVPRTAEMVWASVIIQRSDEPPGRVTT